MICFNCKYLQDCKYKNKDRENTRCDIYEYIEIKEKNRKERLA